MATMLRVHVQPRAATTEVVGWHGDAVKVRLVAPPVDGAANEALCRFLAERLGIARAAVRIMGGARGRAKRVAIEGLAREEVLRALGLDASSR